MTVHAGPADDRCAWIEGDDVTAWDAAVRDAGADVYHRAWLHRLAHDRGEGTGRLFVYRNADTVVALPLLLRAVPGSNDVDVTSVHGYPGPAYRGRATQPRVAAFQSSLADRLRALRVVSVFSRIHPVFDGSVWLRGLGSLHDDGTTVSVSLRDDADARRARYRPSHRREIARLRRSGYTVHVDDGAIDAFHRLYAAAMLRFGAGSRHTYSKSELQALVRPSTVRLFVVRHGGFVAAAGVFSADAAGAHYMLSATCRRHRRSSPSKLMIDAACDWARERGAPWMHLGGGVGGLEDSLFRFKAGFGDGRHRFRTWRWIVRPPAYRAHCERGGSATDGGFFPAYRRG